MKLFPTLILCLAAIFNALANEGYRIVVKIDGFDRDSLFLGYHFGNQQYLKDTAVIDAKGQFVFAGEKALPGGMYLVIMPPKNDYFEILVNEGEQHFTLSTRIDDLAGAMRVQGAPDNQLLYEYLQFLNQRRPIADSLRKAMERLPEGTAQRGQLQSRLDALNKEVESHRRQLVERHPKTLTAAIIRASTPIELPEFEGLGEEEKQIQRWLYSLEHCFDNIDLGDPRMLRTPFLFERIDYFVNKLHIQHPDTLSKAIDVVLEKVAPAPETFRYYLIHFINEAAKSKIVGMDAVYVHLAEKYYTTGRADWTDPEQLEKIVDNARRLKPLLIGKIAPDFTAQRRDGSSISLHNVPADYTILYFWRYDCGVCKSSTPHLKEFYQQFKDKGVEIFAVCSKRDADEIKGCWEYIDENGIGNFIHVVDPGYRSYFPVLYDLQSTPQIYVLDRDKKIISKRLGAEQLLEVMPKLMEMRDKQ
jgi:thiol-disulfide isomerase/thioredoxin